MKTRFEIKCPYCDRVQRVECFKAVPRHRFDCKGCGAVADIHWIKAIRQGDCWSVEWSSSNVDA